MSILPFSFTCPSFFSVTTSIFLYLCVSIFPYISPPPFPITNFWYLAHVFYFMFSSFFPGIYFFPHSLSLCFFLSFSRPFCLCLCLSTCSCLSERIIYLSLLLVWLIESFFACEQKHAGNSIMS